MYIWPCHRAKSKVFSRLVAEKQLEIHVEYVKLLAWGENLLCGMFHFFPRQVTYSCSDDVQFFFHLCQRTPYYIATDENIEKYLVDHGADVNVKDGVSSSIYICHI